MAAPLEQVAAPLEQVAAPLEQVEAPLEQVAAPLEQMEAPLEQVAAPLEQVEAPLEQMAAPLEQSFLFDILRGLAYCHSQGVIHRDLKLHSMLLDPQNNRIKIAGFGQSRMFPTRSGVYTPKVGTLRYKSPEILLGSKRYSPSIDMWSVGCIFAEMLLSRHLFSGNDVREQLVVIFSIVGTPSVDTWPGFSDMPDFEPSFYNIPCKNWTQLFPSLEEDGIDLISRMLLLDPERRIDAQTALGHDYFLNHGFEA
ncbi:hypothetical protein Q3G72_002008 [Acer saccharum]|nr:hypothetical protein Q3G72_002008 [Acer saccharum]